MITFRYRWHAKESRDHQKDHWKILVGPIFIYTSILYKIYYTYTNTYINIIIFHYLWFKFIFNYNKHINFKYYINILNLIVSNPHISNILYFYYYDTFTASLPIITSTWSTLCLIFMYNKYNNYILACKYVIFAGLSYITLHYYTYYIAITLYFLYCI